MVVGMYNTEIFDRTEVDHFPPRLEMGKRKLLACSNAARKRVRKELKSVCELLYRQCKSQPHPKTIHTKTIGRLSEPNSFFGRDLVEWLADNNWADNEADAILTCEIMYSDNIVIAVYPFIKKFVNDLVLYKFSRDDTDAKSNATPRKGNTFKIAKEICMKRIQDQNKRSKHPSSSTGSGSSSPKQSSSSRHGSNMSDSSAADPTKIAGNMLLSLIDKGCDGELTCQLMLRYGYILPVFKRADSITKTELKDKQKFYAQEKYRFSDMVVRSVNRLATTASRSRKNSTLVHAIDRRLSEPGSPPCVYPVIQREHVLEKPACFLQKPCFFAQTVPRSQSTLDFSTVDEESDSVFHSPTRPALARRYSTTSPPTARNNTSFLKKFRKQSK